MVVGWSLSKDISATNTVIKAFKNACRFRQPSPNLIFHSDRGVQYACEDFNEEVKAVKGIQSMSRKGNCWGNASTLPLFLLNSKYNGYRINL